MISGAATENRSYYRGQACEVRNTHNGRETWRSAKIHRTTSRGCEVIYSIGPQTPQHIMFADVRPMEKSERPRPQVTTPLLTAEDIERINKELEAAEQQAKAAAPKPGTTTTTALALVPRSGPRKRAPRLPREHHATPLSQYLRNARATVGIQQQKLAELSGVPQPRLSKIECGDVDPSDDELQALIIPLQLDLDHVLRLRELDDFEKLPTSSTPPPPATPEPAESGVSASPAPLAPTLMQLVRTPPAPIQPPPIEGAPGEVSTLRRTLERLEQERNELLEECSLLRRAVVFYAGAMDQRGQ